MLGSRAVFISGTLKCVAKGNGVGMPKKGRLFEKSADASMVFVVLALAFAWSIDAGAPLEGYAPSIRFDYLLLGSCCALAALIPGAVRKMTSSVCPRGLVISGFAGVLLSVASTWGGAILAYAAALCTVVFQTVVLLGCFARLSRLKMTLVLLWLAFWLCATGALIVVIALLPSSLHQIIANGVATVLIVLFLLASRKGFVVPGDLRGGDIDDSASQPFLPVGLFVVQFAVLFVIKACGVIASPHFVLASGLGFAIAALTVVAFSLFGGKVIKLKGLYNLSLLCAELALLAASLGAMGYLAAGALNGVAYAFFAVFCFAVYCAICLRHRLHPIKNFPHPVHTPSPSRANASHRLPAFSFAWSRAMLASTWEPSSCSFRRCWR